MGPSAEERVAAFQQAVAKSAADADNLDLMTEAIQAIEVRKSSPDRAVTVVAGPGGSVRSISFTDAALGQSAQALSRVTTSTLQQAVAEAARSQAEIVQRYAGEHIDITSRVTLLQDEMFKEPEQDGFQLHRPESDSDGLMSAANDRAAWSEPRPPQQQFTPPQPGFGQQQGFGQQPGFAPQRPAGPQFGGPPPHQPGRPAPQQPQHQARPRPRPDEAEPDDGYTLKMEED